MIYVTGDTHGDFSRFSKENIKKIRPEDFLIVCGDFGFLWTGDENEKKVLNQISKIKSKILFVDGEHENFDLLNSCEEVDFYGGRAHKISHNIYHLMRGQLYSIEKNDIFTFGGGESADRDLRAEEGTFWECELPSIDEMKMGVKILDDHNRKVDYIITHEPPAGIKNLLNKTSDNGTNRLNTFFESMSEKVEYTRWFFGAMHIDKNISTRYRSLFTDVVPINE